MAETDGTPRYRKSKPPKGATGSGAPARNSSLGGKGRKGAALRETLQSGVALEPDSNRDPAADVNAPDSTNSVVKTTMPTMIRADGSPDALAETHTDIRHPSARSTAPLAGGQPGPGARTVRPALGSTLRMELTVHKAEGSEPRIQVRTTAPADSAPRAGEAADNLPVGSSTLQHGQARSRKATTQGFAPAFPDPSAPRARTTRFHVGDAAADSSAANPRFEETLRRGGDFDAQAQAGAQASSGAPFMSTTGTGSTTGNSNRPRRPRRPGERTLIMTKRPKQGSKRDWVFVVLLVAALGLTASMFLSQQTPAEEVVDASAYEEDLQAEEEAQDQFAPTTLRPWVDKDKNKNQPSQSDTSALTAREPSVAANSVQATELRSQPSGAEVIAGNAVVGSTPVRVARGSTDMVYVLRLAGRESKVVRVGPSSPPAILVELGPLAPPGAAQAPAAASGSP